MKENNGEFFLNDLELNRFPSKNHLSMVECRIERAQQLGANGGDCVETNSVFEKVFSKVCRYCRSVS